MSLFFVTLPDVSIATIGRRQSDVGQQLCNGVNDVDDADDVEDPAKKMKFSIKDFFSKCD